MKRTILFLGVLLTLVASVLAVDLPGNSSYSFNWTNASNESENIVFFCQPLVVSVVNQTNISLALDPGQTYNLENAFVNLHATCGSLNVSDTNVCTINRLLNPGELYERHNGACDLNFRCEEDLPEEDEDVCLGVVNMNYTEDYSISLEDDKVLFKFAGEEKVFPVNVSFDWQSQIKYSCEVPVDIDAEDLGPQLSDLCSDTNPYLLDWYDTQVKAYTTLRENCDSNKDENRDTELNLRSKISACEEAKTSCAGDVRGLEGKLSSLEDSSAQVSGEKSMWSALAIMLLVSSSLLFLVCVVLAFLYFREKRLKEAQ